MDESYSLSTVLEMSKEFRNKFRKFLYMSMLYKFIFSMFSVQPAEPGAVDRTKSERTECALQKLSDKEQTWRVKTHRLKRLIATIKHQRLETQRQKSTETCTKDQNKLSTLRMERLASNPEPWTNWSTFWTSEQSLDFSMLISPTTSKNSLRLDQNQSGLFDNGKFLRYKVVKCICQH